MEENVRRGKSGWAGLSRWARSLRPDPGRSIGVLGGQTLIQEGSDEDETPRLKWKQD